MGFTESLLEKIEEGRKHSAAKRLQCAKSIVIWGTGIAAGMVHGRIKDLGMDIKFFAESNQSGSEKEFCGKGVKGIDDIAPDDFVVIAANFKYAIHEKLQAAGINNFAYLDPHLFCNAAAGSFERLVQENADKIDQVYGMLEDHMSQKTFENILLHRAVHNIELMEEIYEEPPYFGNDVIGEVSGTFVDCGAFQGDTLQQFLAQASGSYKYFAIEPEAYNYKKLTEYCEENKIEHVVCLNLGVWDKKEKLYFCGEQGADTGKIISGGSEGSTIINADTLDHIVGAEDVSFVKMDIEGAEPNALLGGQAVIKENKPVLAISAYHEPEHLWEIPILIKSFYQGYRICFRHHSWNVSDTLCYAIADK